MTQDINSYLLNIMSYNIIIMVSFHTKFQEKFLRNNGFEFFWQHIFSREPLIVRMSEDP